jgi:hypothetical protein
MSVYVCVCAFVCVCARVRTGRLALLFLHSLLSLLSLSFCAFTTVSTLTAVFPLTAITTLTAVCVCVCVCVCLCVCVHRFQSHAPALWSVRLLWPPALVPCARMQMAVQLEIYRYVKLTNTQRCTYFHDTYTHRHTLIHRHP